jgi:hypothetical protein
MTHRRQYNCPRGRARLSAAPIAPQVCAPELLEALKPALLSGLPPCQLASVEVLLIA